MHACPIQQTAQYQPWDQNDPEADESVGQVALPTPGSTIDGSKDATPNQVSAQNEKDENGLMPGCCQDIGNSKKRSMGWNLRIVDEVENLPMRKQDQYRR
jgi:hypothetical protein